MRARVSMNARGFTVIELIVVIGVLIVFSSRVLVGSAMSKGTAGAVQCKNNLRLHGLAMNSFLADQSVYPLAINPDFRNGASPEHQRSFLAALSSHGLGPLPDGGVRNTVYVCPSGLRQTASIRLGGLSVWYGYNARGLQSESQIASPTHLMAMGDGVKGWGEVYQDSVWLLARSRDAEDHLGSTKRVLQRHAKRLNVLFGDGHIDKLSLNLLFGDRSDTALKLWNRDNEPHRDRLP